MIGQERAPCVRGALQHRLLWHLSRAAVP